MDLKPAACAWEKTSPERPTFSSVSPSTGVANVSPGGASQLARLPAASVPWKPARLLCCLTLCRRQRLTLAQTFWKKGKDQWVCKARSGNEKHIWSQQQGKVCFKIGMILSGYKKLKSRDLERGLRTLAGECASLCLWPVNSIRLYPTDAPVLLSGPLSISLWVLVVPLFLGFPIQICFNFQDSVSSCFVSALSTRVSLKLLKLAESPCTDLCPQTVHEDFADVLGCLHLQLMQAPSIWSWAVAFFYPVCLPS